MTADDVTERVRIARDRVGHTVPPHPGAPLAADPFTQTGVHRGPQRLRRQRANVYAFMVEQWIQAGQFVVVREEPVLTSRGKFQPFRPLPRRA